MELYMHSISEAKGTFLTTILILRIWDYHSFFSKWDSQFKQRKLSFSTMLFCRSFLSFLFIVVRCTLSTFFAGYFLSFMLNSPFLPSFNILLYNRKLLPNSNVSLFNIHNFLPLDFKIEGQIVRCQQQHSCSKCEK